MILDLLWQLVRLMLLPLQMLPDVITSTGQFDAVVQMLTAANRVVDIPMIFAVIGVMIGVMATVTPVTLGLKLYKLIRGAGS